LDYGSSDCNPWTTCKTVPTNFKRSCLVPLLASDG
jgi:hypothetical protein